MGVLAGTIYSLWGEGIPDKANTLEEEGNCGIAWHRGDAYGRPQISGSQSQAPTEKEGL